MKLLFVVLAVCTVALGESPCSTEFVASPIDQIRIGLKMANVSKTDVVYDLGSGDGAVVITAAAEFSAGRAIGIEIQPKLVDLSRRRIHDLKLLNAQIVEGDMFKSDVKGATVVYINLPCAKDAVVYACKVAPKARMLVTGNQLYYKTTLLKHSYSMEGGVSLFRCDP